MWCLRNIYTFAAMDFGRRLGARCFRTGTRAYPAVDPWERATTPPPKRHAALRVALKLAWGFVAQSVEYRWGYTPSFAPRPRPISAQRMYSYFGDTTLGPDRSRICHFSRPRSVVRQEPDQSRAGDDGHGQHAGAGKLRHAQKRGGRKLPVA